MSKQKIIGIIAVIVVVGIALSIWISKTNKSGSTDGDSSLSGYAVTDVSFDSTTITKEPITSAVFEDYDITMINIWATWCGPCRNEMPLLAELYQELPDNVNLIGIATDAGNDMSLLEYANEIIDTSGGEFQNVILDDNLLTFVQEYAYYIPTTVFVDKNGKVVGKVIEGVPANDSDKVVQAYKDAIEHALSSLE